FDWSILAQSRASQRFNIEKSNYDLVDIVPTSSTREHPRQHRHRPALQQPAPAAHRHLQPPNRTTLPKKATHYQLCEKHYQANTTRLSDGRYQVRLPMKTNAPSDLVNSHQIAYSCLLSLERKLCKNPSLYAEYSAAIQQMIKSDQMRKVSIAPQDYRSHYFLPHHAVVKDSSTMTRVRPVFNASTRNVAVYISQIPAPVPVLLRIEYRSNFSHETTPCARWPLAKITDVHTGRDGLVRVATVATARGSYQRPVAKLIKLLEN
ncbi:unnamed protein product, partial [Trichogramma brassicae]